MTATADAYWADVHALKLDQRQRADMKRFVLMFGADAEVRAVTESLIARYVSGAVDNPVVRLSTQSGDVESVRADMTRFIEFHGPHLWASLGTEAGIRASVQGRQAARGSYQSDT